MKKFSIILCLFLAISFGAKVNGQASLDNENGTSMNPIINELGDVVKVFEDAKFEIVRIEFDLLFDSKFTYRTLSSGYTYGFFVWGDYRISDIVIRVYKKVGDQWQYYADGEPNGNSSSLKFQTTETAEYKFEVKALQFAEGYKAGHYGLIVYHN